MKTTLDTQSWDGILYGGNAQFIETNGVIYVVSQVRADNSFAVFCSSPVPPAPGPGYSFTQIASYTFLSPTKSFDPVCCLDGTVLHIIGAVDNSSHGTDLLKFKIDTAASTPTLSAPVTVVSGSYLRGAYDICVVDTNNPMVVCAVSNPTIPNYVNQSVLLAVELDAVTDATLSTQQLDISTLHGGTAFGAVSVVTPDGESIEVYYESYPKTITFKDVQYNINLVTRTSSLTWQPPISIYSFIGSNADNRMTVIARGTQRFLSQIYFNTNIHKNAFVGSLILGYFNGTVWQWAITPGSFAGGSLIQAGLSISATQGVYVTYLAEPSYSRKGAWSATLSYNVNDQVVYNKVGYVAVASVIKGQLTPDVNPNWTLLPASWPLHVASVNLAGLNLEEIPGNYNNTNLTWVRGSKSILDDSTLWALIGESEQGSTISPVYLSGCNVPPVVSLNSSNVTSYRGRPATLTAFSTDENSDNLQYVWVDNAVDPNISLSGNGASATLSIAPSIGGSPTSFNVAALVFDLMNGVSLHPPMTVTGIKVVSNVLTVYTNAPVSLAVGQDVLLYQITYPSSLNVIVVTVAATGTNQFRANVVHSDLSLTNQTGYAVAQFDPSEQRGQFALCEVTVPLNISPQIDFHTDRVTGNAVSNPIQAGRNSMVTVNPVISGVSDADDTPLYLWVQTSGTLVSLLSGSTSPSLEIFTGGVNVLGETITFQLTVSDGVNTPAVSSINVTVAPYTFLAEDTSVVSTLTWSGTIAQRNQSSTWGDSSAVLIPGGTTPLVSDLTNMKRSATSAGADRVLLISDKSVIAYDGLTTPAFTRIMLTPGCVPVADAVQTESDYTLVLDNAGRILQYGSTSGYTDNPEVIINLSKFSNFSFTQILSTPLFGGSRVLVISGMDGCLLLQVNPSMEVLNFMELAVEFNLLYGADNIQWVRISNVENLNKGQVLLGSVQTTSASIQSITILNNTLTVRVLNTVAAGKSVALNGITTASFLNGVSLNVLAANSQQLIASFKHADYPTTLDTGTISYATRYYETLIDLSKGRVVGTWNSSNLRNQIVTSGEFLFNSSANYSGTPSAPVLAPISLAANGVCGLSWSQTRADLVSSYLIESSSSLDGGATWSDWVSLDIARSGAVTSISEILVVGRLYNIRIQAQSVDGISPYSNVQPINVTSITTPSNGVVLTEELRMAGLSVVSAVALYVPPPQDEISLRGVQVVSWLVAGEFPLSEADVIYPYGVIAVSNLPITQKDQIGIIGAKSVSTLPTTQKDQVGIVGIKTVSIILSAPQDEVSLTGVRVVSGLTIMQTDQLQVVGGAITSSLTVVQKDQMTLTGVKVVSVFPLPTVTSLSTTSGLVGSAVTISGSYFGSVQNTSTVSFNGTLAVVTSWSNTSISVTVPSGASAGNVVVSVNGTPSNGVLYTVIPNPVLTSLSASSGAVGTSVTLTGVNFGVSQGSSAVALNGSVVSPTSWGNTSIGITVPTSAVSGNLAVTVNGYTSNGLAFTVIPSLSSLSPTVGSAGVSVTLTGTGFGTTGSVSFNGTTATATNWGVNSITVSVPAGAFTGVVTVTVGGVVSNGITFTMQYRPSNYTDSGTNPTSTPTYAYDNSSTTYAVVAGYVQSGGL